MRLVAADVVIRVNVICGADANAAGINIDIIDIEVGRVRISITACFTGSCSAPRAQVTPSLPPGDVVTTAATHHFLVKIIRRLLPARHTGA